MRWTWWDWSLSLGPLLPSCEISITYWSAYFPKFCRCYYRQKLTKGRVKICDKQVRRLLWDRRDTPPIFGPGILTQVSPIISGVKSSQAVFIPPDSTRRNIELWILCNVLLCMWYPNHKAVVVKIWRIFQLILAVDLMAFYFTKTRIYFNVDKETSAFGTSGLCPWTPLSPDPMLCPRAVETDRGLWG